jgi:hypothetical protein
MSLLAAVGRPQERVTPDVAVGRDATLRGGRRGRGSVARRPRRRSRQAAGGVAHVDLVLAAAVAQVGDPAPVGRPDGVHRPHPRRDGQLDHLALLGRHGEHLAADGEDGALAGRRDVGSLDAGLDALPVGQRQRQIARDADRHLDAAAGRDVEEVEEAAVLVDDLAGLGVGAWPQDVVGVVAGELADLPRLEVVGVEVQGVLAVRGEVDLAADPHRLVVGDRIVDDALRLVGREVVDPDVLGAPAAVPLPAAELGLQGRVDEPGPVGREAAVAALRDAHRPLHAAGRGHQVGPADALAPRHPVGTEDDVLAVRRPAEHLVVIAAARRQRADVVVERQLARCAAVDADHEYLAVAAVFAGEGDPASVGRELGEELEPRMGGQSARAAAAGVHHPDVAGIDERDLVAMDVGVAQQAGLDGGPARDRRLAGRGRRWQRRGHGEDGRHGRGGKRREFGKCGKSAQACGEAAACARRPWAAELARCAGCAGSAGSARCDGQGSAPFSDRLTTHGGARGLLARPR